MLASLRFRVSCRCSDHYLQHIGGLEKGYPSVVVAVFMNPGVALCFFFGVDSDCRISRLWQLPDARFEVIAAI